MRLIMPRGLSVKRRRTVPGHGQKGEILIELLVSIAIFGVISVGFLSALVTGYHGVIVAHDQTMAENLIRTTFEDISIMSFDAMPIGTDNVTQISKYDVVVHADYVTDSYEVTSDPTYIQMITVTVRHHKSGRPIMSDQRAKVGL
jgi:type II secretory pathway pseudopilin PulG